MFHDILSVVRIWKFDIRFPAILNQSLNSFNSTERFFFVKIFKSEAGKNVNFLCFLKVIQTS